MFSMHEDEQRGPSMGLTRAGKIIACAAGLFTLPALYLIIDDLSTRGEFLDGLVASFAGVFLGGCATVLVLAWASLTRTSARYQMVWLVLASLGLAGLLACVVLTGLLIGSGG